jgi:two-component system CheB/CheR fusion protein
MTRHRKHGPVEHPGADQPSDSSELRRLDAAMARIGGGNDPFASAVWATRMPIVVTSPRQPDNPIVFVNNAFCSMTGYSREDIVGRNCRFLQGPDTDPAKVASLRQAVLAAVPIDLEIRNYRKDGQPFWNRLHMVPLHDSSGALTYFFASQLDVTVECERLALLERQNAALVAERDARQHADFANAEKSRFLAVASHDIRQPLQSLVLLQGILAKTIQGEAAEKLVSRLGQTLESMSGMLNSLLDLNQIEAGAARTNIADTSVGGILTRLQDAFAYEAQAKGIALHVVRCSLYVRSDPRLLEQMLRNLLSNALKYTRHGKVVLGCRRRGARLSIEVWDTGIGISEAEIDAIFREYHQIDTMDRQSGRGLGLGLSIAHRFAALLGHNIRVRSVLGRGSMFAIDLDRAQGRAESAAAPVAANGEDGVAQRAGRVCSILLIDDDPETRDILGAFLTDEGYTVFTAHDGLQALHLVEVDGARPDIVVTDSRLATDRSGPEITARLRDRLTRDVPIITLTGDMSTGAVHVTDMRNAIRLTKPVKLPELTTAIQLLLAPADCMPGASVRGDDDFNTGLAGALIYIVDDNLQVNTALRAVIENDGGEAETHLTAEAFCDAYHPGRIACLLVDAYLPGMNGIALLRYLRSRGDTLPAIMITGHSDVSMAVEAMKAGASDFIEKPVRGGELLASIKQALGRSRNAGKLAAWHEEAGRHVADLTPRQREIMALVLAGHPSKNIAADLGISQRTVENHRASIMRKTQAKSLPALARLALAADWDVTNPTPT